MLGTLFTLPPAWEMITETSKWTIATMWFFITTFWQLWILLLAVLLIKIFLEKWLPDYLKQRKEKK